MIDEFFATSPWYCSTFLAAQKLHVWHHGVGSFWWRNLELIRRRSSSCPTFWYFAKVLDFFHMNSTQCHFPNINYNLGTVSWQRFRKARRSLCCHVGNFFDLSLNAFIFSGFVKSCRKDSLFGDSRIAASTFRLILCDSCPVVGLWNGVCLVFKSQRCRCGFPRNFPIRFWWSEDFLASCSCWSCCPLWEFGFSITRDNLGDYLLLSLHAYRFLNTNHWQCAWKSDCVWSCLIKLQSFFLSELLIAPIHCILMRSPSIFIWCDPWRVQVASNFFHALIVVHRVHCSEKHGLPVPFETSSSCDQSTSDYWMYFTYSSDVIDELGEVFWQQYIVLQCRINEITSWMSLNCFEIQEVLGRVTVQAILKPFLWSSSFFAREFVYASTVHSERPTNFTLNFSIRSSNLTAPSSSREIDSSCRSYLIMAFDTVQLSWRNLSGLMSLQFFSRTGIEMWSSVTVGIDLGFPFATSYPVTLCSTFSREMVSHVSITYLSIPFRIRTSRGSAQWILDVINIWRPVKEGEVEDEVLSVLYRAWHIAQERWDEWTMFGAHNPNDLDQPWATDVVQGMSAMWCVDTLCASAHAVWEGVLFTLPVGCLGIESCQQAKNNYLNKRKCCRNHLMQQFLLCLGFPPLIFFFTVQSRLKIANNPNFDSTFIHRSAATARMKTILLKDNISIQFEGEPFRRTPRVHQVVVENFDLFVVMDGLTYFLVRYFSHILWKVNDKRASIHENQVFVLLDLVLLLKQFSSSFAIVAFHQL